MNYYDEIKTKVIDNEVCKKVKNYSKNRNDLTTYYEIGRLLIEAQGGEKRAKYGNNLIREYSEKLSKDIGKKYDVTTLKRMRQFYLIIEKGATLWHQLSWSIYKEILSLTNISSINYYLDISIKYNLSVRELHSKIKLKEYDRLPEKTKQKLISNTILESQDLIKNPIIINNPSNKKKISEKALKLLILEDIDSFLIELGERYSYIASEYKIRVGNINNYIDILLFNIKYNCYVVVELKITELKKEHIAQIQVYMNYIDKNLKTINQDKTIGLIICKKDNKFIIEYSSDPRIYSTTYNIVG